MGCGTPVLATSVGGVPDVIKDEETGFIMKDNTPECIAENVERVLNYPCLNEIVKNARELVEKEFTSLTPNHLGDMSHQIPPNILSFADQTLNRTDTFVFSYSPSRRS